MALDAAGLGVVVVVAGLWATGPGPFGGPRPAPEEVLGMMRDASDVSGVGGASTRGGRVLAVPAGAAPDFWRLIELLAGFITAEPYTVMVRTDDTGHAWTVRISEGPFVTTPIEAKRANAVFSAPQCRST
ncbi:hypothetical protein AB0H57_31700 [Micromonospora sp. NPDC050686]|uniref:hypothetical protein n=1 Tax=Micromonospora sp. NPDC050686 TaxID=3154631 RepID=UPI0033FFFB83